jgi:hypothetical protein
VAGDKSGEDSASRNYLPRGAGLSESASMPSPCADSSALRIPVMAILKMLIMSIFQLDVYVARTVLCSFYLGAIKNPCW